MKRMNAIAIPLYLIVFILHLNDPFFATTPKTSQIDSSSFPLYLPIVIGPNPITPTAPTLNPISNPDGDGSYTVSWSASSGASSYLLQESPTPDFTNPTPAYTGSNTSTAIFGKALGTYYYRVQASSTSGSSPWSNIESVVVTDAESTIMYGDWYGETSWIYQIDLSVVSEQLIQTLDIALDWHNTCGYGMQYLRLTNIPINEGSFSVPTPSLSGLGIDGTFSSPTSVSGTFTAKVRHPTTLCQATMTGSWKAVRPVQGYSDTYAIALQPDGKVVLGGDYTMVQGQPQRYLARLNPDGTLDAAFNPGGNENVLALALQSDGKILAGGWFTEMGGQPRSHLARLNPDGSLDASFNPGADADVTAFLVQSNGTILVGGEFEQLGGQPCMNLGLLNPNGSLEACFDSEVWFYVYALAVQPDGKILVGGMIDAGPGVDRGRLIRLNPDGSLDEGFSPQIKDQVAAVAVQSDGKILLGGWFNFIDDVRRNYLARLNADGSLDQEFDPNARGTSTANVRSLVVQPDQKILVGGYYSIIDSQTAYRLARLNPNGSLDTSFTGRASGQVNALALQPDGKVWIGGDIYYVNGQAALGFARLNTDGPLDLTGQ
jgi:uncharacterized delta-60 repeat protein